MSFENKNLYHLLGNDVEEEETSNIPPREIVRNKTSSKKTDEAPPKADPARAKNKKKVGGNEGAIKTQLNNKSVPGPDHTESSHYKRPFDRHSRQQKGDSGKKTKQEGWGSKNGANILEDEVEADEDAEAELEEGDENVIDEVPKKSLQDYFEELKLKQSQLEGNKQLRQANDGDDAKWAEAERLVKEQEEYVPSSTQKKVKSKSPKEKQFLDFEATFADEQPTPFPSSRGRGAPRGGRGSSRGASRGGARGGRGSSRGARGGARGGRGSARGGAAPKPTINDKDFPSL